MVQHNTENSLALRIVFVFTSLLSLSPVLLLCHWYARQIRVASKKAGAFTADLWNCEITTEQAIPIHIEILKMVAKLEKQSGSRCVCVQRLTVLGMFGALGLAETFVKSIGFRFMPLPRRLAIRALRMLSLTLTL